MKKWLALFFAVCLVVVVAGCNGDGGTINEDSAEPGSSIDSESGNTSGDDVVQLTAIMVKHSLTKPLAEMEWLQKAEKDAGVSIKWEEVTSDWNQKKGTLLASGDIPDLIFGNNVVTDGDIAQFPGLFADMTDLIQNHGPNVQKMFDEKPELKTIATALDGKIYGLPKYQRYWPATVTRQYINQQWLDDLGLEVPTTWDELYNVLVAFKQQDANGNGDPNDEIPMDFAPVATTGFGGFQPTVLLGSLGITLSENSPQGFFVEDGKVKNFLVDDRYKSLIEFLNKCWEAGLINPETFTQDYTKFQSVARGDGETGKVGFSWGWVASDRFGATLADQYTPLGPLKHVGSNAQLSWSYDYNSLNYGMNMVVMSGNSANKDAAMKFINELYDPLVSMQVLFGSIGPNIKDNGDGSYEVLPPQDPKMDPGTWKWTSTWADFAPKYISDDLNLKLGTDMQEVTDDTKPLQQALDNIDQNKDILPSMFMKYSVQDNNTMTLNNTNLLNLAIPKFSQWITTGGVDKEWDAYLNDAERTGLPQTLEIMQKYYDEFTSKNN